MPQLALSRDRASCVQTDRGVALRLALRPYPQSIATAPARPHRGQPRGLEAAPRHGVDGFPCHRPRQDEKPISASNAATHWPWNRLTAQRRIACGRMRQVMASGLVHPFGMVASRWIGGSPLALGMRAAGQIAGVENRHQGTGQPEGCPAPACHGGRLRRRTKKMPHCGGSSALMFGFLRPVSAVALTPAA